MRQAVISAVLVACACSPRDVPRDEAYPVLIPLGPALPAASGPDPSAGIEARAAALRARAAWLRGLSLG
jgi:p-aminobenzoyl-glutamate transporter AbgT